MHIWMVIIPYSGDMWQADYQNRFLIWRIAKSAKHLVAAFRAHVVCSIYEFWLPEDGLLLRVYVSRTHVFWREEIAKPIG